MPSKALKDLVGKLPSEYIEFAEDGLDADIEEFVDTGSYAFNALLSGSLYGGFPTNRISVLCAENSSGKTFYALSAVKYFLKKFPGSIAVYFDTESAVTTQMLTSRNIDPSRVAVIGVSTLEDFRHNAVTLLDNYMKQDESERPRMMLVLDSFGMLSSEKEMEDTSAGKNTVDMTKGRIAKGIFRVLMLKLAKAKVPMIINVHQYLQQGAMFPQAIPAGGEGLKYACSHLIFMSKSKEKDGTEVVGAIIKCKTGKSRCTKEQKIVETRLFFDRGLDRYYGLIPIALKYEIFKQEGPRIVMPDGTKVYESKIYKDPTKYFTDEIMAKLEEACKDEFHYMRAAKADEDEEDNGD